SFLGERHRQRFLEHQKSFCHKERIALLLLRRVLLNELFDRQLLVILRVVFPQLVFEGDLVGRFEATKRQLKIEIIKFVAEQFRDARRRIALDQVIADEMQDVDEGGDVVAHHTGAGRGYASTSSSSKGRSR